MGTLTKGDIVLFPFPYTNMRQQKLRPCLVLSHPMGKDILLCQITSQKIPKDRYTIPLLEKHMYGSLRIDSYIRANMLFTAETQQVKGKLCRIKTQKYRQVVRTITKLMDK